MAMNTKHLTQLRSTSQNKAENETFVSVIMLFFTKNLCLDLDTEQK